MPIVGGDGVRRARRRLGAPVDGRGLRRRRRPRRSRRSRCDRRGDPGGARAPRRARAGRPRARARGSRGAPPASRSSPATRRPRRDPRRASTSRRSCRRAPARRGTFAGCWARSRGGTGSRWRRARSAAPARRPRSRATRGGTTPGCRARRAGSTCSTARPSAARCARPCRSPSRCTTSRSSGIPSSSRAGTGSRAAPGSAPSRRAADRVFAVSEFTKREAVELLGVDAERVVVVGNAIEPVFTPDGPAAEGDYVLAVGDARAAQEPPPDRRGGRARRRRAPGRRRARLGRRRDARLARRGRRRGARRALPRRACARLPVALRGLRHPGARGDGVRHAGRDEPRAARPRRSPAARRCSSTRSTSSRSPPGSRRPSSRRDELRAARPRARAARTRGRRSPTRSNASGGSSHDAARRRRRRRARPRAARATRRTSSTCSASWRRSRLRPAFAIAAVTRHPELVPEGIEAVELRDAVAGAAHGSDAAAAAPPARRRARALPVRAPARARRARRSSRSTTSPSSASPSLMSRKDRLVFRRVVPRAARKARRVLTVSERTRRDLRELYDVPDEKIVVTPNGVDPAFTPGDGRARLRPRSSGRCRSGRTRWRRSPRPTAAGLPLVVAGPAKDEALARELERRGARVARLRRPGRARPSSTAARPASCSRRASKASACPCSRRWPAGRPSSPCRSPHCGRSPATPPSGSRSTSSGTGSAARVAERERLAAAGLERARLFSWRETARQDARGLPGGARTVKVSAVVVSHGHARELERSLPALAPQVDELVVIANLPGQRRVEHVRRPGASRTRGRPRSPRT